MGKGPPWGGPLRRLRDGAPGSVTPVGRLASSWLRWPGSVSRQDCSSIAREGVQGLRHNAAVRLLMPRWASILAAGDPPPVPGR